MKISSSSVSLEGMNCYTQAHQEGATCPSTFRRERKFLMTSILATVLAWVLIWAAGAVVLMIVSRLNLGLSVESFGAAFIASAVISVVAGLIHWFFGFIGFEIVNPNLLGAIVGLIVAAVVLLISDRFVKGMKVNGFVGALIAAAAYGVVVWLLQWVIGLFV